MTFNQYFHWIGPHVTFHMSRVTSHISRVMCHKSHVTCHMLCVTCICFVFTKWLSFSVEGLLSTEPTQSILERIHRFLSLSLALSLPKPTWLLSQLTPLRHLPSLKIIYLSATCVFHFIQSFENFLATFTSYDFHVW